MEGIDIQAIVRQAVQEFVNNEQAKTEPAHKAELQEERKRREQLERRLNELVEENKRSRKMAAEAERSSTVRAELQRLGVGKIDLAYSQTLQFGAHRRAPLCFRRHLAAALVLFHQIGRASCRE